MSSALSEIRYLVAENIWFYRTLSGLTCSDLGAVIGETGAQVMQYENGAEEVAAEKLFAFAELIGVPIGAFFIDHSTTRTPQDLCPAKAAFNAQKSQCTIGRSNVT